MDETPKKLEGAKLKAAFEEWSALEKRIPAMDLELARLKARRDQLSLELHAALVGTRPRISRREQEVFKMIKENKTNKEIGVALSISERTVKFHVSSLLAKFDKRNRYDL